MNAFAKAIYGVLTVLFYIFGFCQLACEFFMSRLKFLLFKLKNKPRPDDIFIVSYPKSGTTWMQMILYQLTTDGNMDFPHIGALIPHYEEDLVARDFPFDGLRPPRVFKTHLVYQAIPKSKARYIYLMRNGQDVAVSYYHHYRDLRGFKAPFSQFFRVFLQGKVAYGSWFKHVAGWRAHGKKLNVLYVKYEDLSKDFKGTVTQIAEFCGITVPEEAWPRIEERCSFAFMKSHEKQFDLSQWLHVRCELTANRHLREGKTGGGAEKLDPQQLALYEKFFNRYLGKRGLADYDARKAKG